MAIATGDLLQFVDKQVFLSQEILNVYYYRYFAVVGVGVEAYEELADDWVDNILTPIRLIQSTILDHTTLEIRNLTNGLDVYEATVNLNGGVSSTEDTVRSSFEAASFKLQRGSLATRNGAKRFAGLPESMWSGNTYSGDPDLITDVRAALARNLQIGLVDVAAPVIVHRPIPVPADPYIYSTVVGVSFSGIGSQNTRKP